MTVTHIAYTKVARDQQVPELTLRAHEPGVDAFLLDHVTELRKKSGAEGAPLATFKDPDAAELFEHLRAGTNEQFLVAAKSLADRLVQEMDGRSAEGLLVFLRVDVDEKLSGAALKLQVVTEHAARLEQVSDGELSLSAVQDVLDAPGKLQKGALVADTRAGSDVIIGDLLPQDAQYFPRAFGIRSEQRSADTATALVSAVASRDQATAKKLVAALPSIPSGPTAEVLAAAAETITELNESTIADVVSELGAQDRPVRNVDTTKPVKQVITADGVSISVPPAAQDRVRVEHDDLEGWRVVVLSADEPVVAYRR